MQMRYLLPFLIILVSLPVSVMAGDLDDGISKFTEGSISSDDQLGQVDRNINFIKLNAKSQADVRSKKGKEQADNPQTGAAGAQPGSGNVNSVLIGPGSNFKGTIVIENKGDVTNIVDK